MKTTRIIFLLIVSLVLACTRQPTDSSNVVKRPEGPDVRGFATTDIRMNSAIREAQRTFDEFIKSVESVREKTAYAP